MPTDPLALERAVESWDERGWERPHVALVAGSGLGVDLDAEILADVELQELLPFAVDPVVGHSHRAQLVRLGSGRVILYYRGRIHSYQGYDGGETVFPVRLAALLGARTLVMTNAAGGLHPRQEPGDLVAIRDHLNLTGLNPLCGHLPEAWGPRFPDLTDAYSAELRQLAAAVAAAAEVELSEGVYAGLAGPSYETPAEVRMLQTLGADLVGMSTVLEVIAARHLGMRCLCFSMVSNLAAGIATAPLDHVEVLEAGRKAAARVRRLLAAVLAHERLVAD